MLLVAIKTALTATKGQLRRGLGVPAEGEKPGVDGLEPRGVSKVWNNGSRPPGPGPGPIEFALESGMPSTNCFNIVQIRLCCIHCSDSYDKLS